MAEDLSHLTEAQKKARRSKKFTYRGVEMDKLYDLSNAELMDLMCARQRRSFSRGVGKGYATLLNKLKVAKKATPHGEKPSAVKTHLRNMIIVPQMVGNVVGIYNGKVFLNAEVKPEMIGTYLAEYSFTYKPIRHGRPGVGTTASRFIPF
mgnify:CR=1 FL=1